MYEDLCKKHTPLPWNLHAAYKGEPLLVHADDGKEPWIAAKLVIAHGDKIIAEVEMNTCKYPGYPRVESMAEMRANAELILQAVNSYYEKREQEDYRHEDRD